MTEPRMYRRNVFQQREVAWLLLVAVCALFIAYRIPTVLVYHAALNVPWFIGEIVVMAVFIIDPIFKFRSAKQRGPEFVRKYVRTWLVFDVIAAIPVILFAAGSPLALLALSKIIPVFGNLSQWRLQLRRGGNAVRFVQFAYILAIVIHLVACGWLVLRSNGQPATDYNYLESIYWTVTTMCTVGYGDITPQTELQMMYATAVMLVGYVLFAYLVGNIASLFNTVDPLRSEHVRTMDQATSFMQYHNVPHHLQHRIIDYLGYMWERKVTYDETFMLDMLPWGLRSEVSMYLRSEVIERVPFFREASESFIREVADSLRPIVVTPGEFVFRYGDRARFMYFISHGSVEVLSSDGSQIGTLQTGDFFGEMALLEKRRRSASIRAIEYSDLYVLDAAAFDHILTNFPEFRDVMEQVSTDRSLMVSELRRMVQ
ncbi:MAG TPA: cyclic nucleotide-binding domain-containing protein [Candidatus Didemnitutus sp.]|nr:cyclic nucleotide-binding domain-containing protein [Candidatus Didemnitutus sp.]